MKDKNTPNTKSASRSKSGALKKDGKQSTQIKSGSASDAGKSAGRSAGNAADRAGQVVKKGARSRSSQTRSAVESASRSIGKSADRFKEAKQVIRSPKISSFQRIRSFLQNTPLRTIMNSQLAVPSLVGVAAVAVAAPIIVYSYLSTRPLALHMEVDTIFATMHSNTFIASGSAVENGYVCMTGIVDEIDYEADQMRLSTQEGLPTNSFDVDKHFICEDGSGSFNLRLTVVLDQVNSVTRGTWEIIGGTGAYAELQGGGTILGVNGDEEHIYDIYDGEVD